MVAASFVVVFVVVAVVFGQKPARIGKDGKPLLNRPELNLCLRRKSHFQENGHHYFLSWRSTWHKYEDWDWFNGRNFCREHCMDLVSFDMPGEFELIKKIMARDKVDSIYSSGRKCNFKGCEGDHLQPINVKGWFWPGAGNSQIPPTDRDDEDTAWSPTGRSGDRQPDNFEGVKQGKIEIEGDKGVTIEGFQEYYDEACLAVLNNKYQDGIKWHDVACYNRMAIICEDSDQLINLVEQEEGVDVRNWTVPAENPVDLKTFKTVPVENSVDVKIFKPVPAENPVNLKTFQTVPAENTVDLKTFKTVPVENPVDLKTFQTVPAENPVDLKTFKTVPVQNSVDVKIFKPVPSANSVDVKLFNSSPSNLKRTTEQPFPHKIFSSDQKTSVSEIVESTTRENQRSTDSEGWYIKPGTTSSSGWYIKSKKTDKKKPTTASKWSLAGLSEWYYGN